MIRPLRIVWSGVIASYEEMLLLALLSLLVCACWLIIIPGPPATAALYCVANRIASERRVNFDVFKEGFRRYFVRSWIISAISLGMLAIIISSLFFYTGLPAQFPQWMQALSVVMLYILIAWLAMQIYLFPVLIEQNLRVWMVFRNALYLAFASPVYTGVLLAALAVIVLLCGLTTILFFLIAPALVAVISSVALQDRLAYFRGKADAAS